MHKLPCFPENYLLSVTWMKEVTADYVAKQSSSSPYRSEPGSRFLVIELYD